jgi:hypothetical protein
MQLVIGMDKALTGQDFTPADEDEMVKTILQVARIDREPQFRTKKKPQKISYANRLPHFNVYPGLTLAKRWMNANFHIFG